MHGDVLSLVGHLEGHLALWSPLALSVIGKMNCFKGGHKVDALIQE